LINSPLAGITISREEEDQLAQEEKQLCGRTLWTEIHLLRLSGTIGRKMSLFSLVKLIIDQVSSLWRVVRVRNVQRKRCFTDK
jgi:hypothetical protein